jgi:hypothetical protein
VTFKPFRCSDGWYGLLAMLGILVVDGLAILYMLGPTVNGVTFIAGMWVLASLPVLAYLGYRTVGSFTMQYWVDRNAITLVWGPTRQVIPITEIERVRYNVGEVSHEAPRYWHWPCPHRRRFRAKGLGVVNAYATRPVAEQIWLITAQECYAITPEDSDGFIEALQERYALGPGRALSAELQRPPLWTWRLWRDYVALFLIAAGLFGVILMFGVYCFRLPSLSADLPLHFDINGLPDRIAPKASLIALPAIGLLAWFINLTAGIWIYRRLQRHGAYLLWGGAVAVQVLAAAALFNIMRW